MGRTKGTPAARRRKPAPRDGDGSSARTGSPKGRVDAGALPRQAVVIDQDVRWAPPFRTAFMLLFAIRLWGAVVNTISDCDEVFNYWEPTHQLLHGRGFQTWEYSPEFALRSYLYTGIHAVVGKAVIVLSGGDKLGMFYAIRCVLAIVSAFTEANLYEAIMLSTSRRIGIFTLAFLGLAAGMFHASSAYLPSTFAMYCVMWAMSSWLRGAYGTTMLAGCVGVLLGWPFSGVVYVPLGLAMLARGGVRPVVIWGVVWSVVILGASAVVDFFYYHKWLVAVWNIVKYNALGGGGGDGSNLYGVEPATFYVANLFLNFNVIFLLALMSVVVVADKRFGGRLSRWMTVAVVAPFWLWFLLMSARDHKEERFMFVIYPVIAVAAAMSLAWLRRVVRYVARVTGLGAVRSVASLMVVALIAVAGLVSASRCIAVISNYGAPTQAFAQFSHVEVPTLEASTTPINICVGKEWYRFPSSFFLPDEPVRAELGFLPSTFKGQLPQPYSSVNATWIVQDGFNDLNKEEVDRYIALEDCDYIVDLDLEHQVEPHYSQLPEWEELWSAPFLDATQSPFPGRAFYLPWLTDRNVYGRYQLLRRRSSA